MNNREILLQYAQKQAPVYQQLALDIHRPHPEVRRLYHEFYASEHLSGQLAAEGFDVKVDVAGHRTGFTACYKAQKAGPVLVFLAEYDALQGLGHGCGHNLFGAMSALAAASLKQVVDAVGGEIRVYGTPGEEGGENGSAKGSFVREGFLKDVDAALCVHPIGGKSLVTAPSLGCAPVDIEFWGKSAHAAANPEAGINALDALILTYNGINALRQHVTPDVRIHGIISARRKRAELRARLRQRQILSPCSDLAPAGKALSARGRHRAGRGADDRRTRTHAALSEPRGKHRADAVV